MKRKPAYIDYHDLIGILPKKGVIALSHAASVPTPLLRWLSINHKYFEHIEIIHMNPKNEVFIANKKYKKEFTPTLFFVHKYVQEAIKDKWAQFIPLYFYESPQYIKQRKVDVYFAAISRTVGTSVSLGISVDYGVSGVKTAKTAVGIQSVHIPFTLGDGQLPKTDFDYIIKDDSFTPAQIAPIGNNRDIIESIAGHVTKLIDDGATLQAGVGIVPDAILRNLLHKKDLGIHSEMMSDNMVQLIQNGNVTNKRKTIHKDVSIVTFAYGTNQLYKFLDQNKKVFFKTVDYVNNPFIIAKNKNVVSINSAVEVDLHGQVNAEMINNTQISGVGGQVDFVRGARLSKNGKSIIAFPSTNSPQTASRIIDRIGKEGITTTSRNDVDFICTEYGCVRLWGSSLTERKKMLISITHPKFRKHLEKAG